MVEPGSLELSYEIARNQPRVTRKVTRTLLHQRARMTVHLLQVELCKPGQLRMRQQTYTDDGSFLGPCFSLPEQAQMQHSITSSKPGHAPGFFCYRATRLSGIGNGAT